MFSLTPECCHLAHKDPFHNMSQARQVIAWLGEQWPNLADLTPEGGKGKLHQMKEAYTESSVRHFLIKTHLLWTRP